MQPLNPRVLQMFNDALTLELTVTNTYPINACSANACPANAGSAYEYSSAGQNTNAAFAHQYPSAA